MSGSLKQIADRLGGVACLFAVLLCAAFPGCNSGARESAPVNASVARDTLERVMETWKQGQSADALQKQSPAIVVQDLDWTSGMKLMGYEIAGEGKESGANLIAQVKLTLADNQGAQTEKTVTYVVGTAPVLTVFRDLLN